MANLKDITPLVLTFVNHRTPELRRAPERHDPDGATLELWLKYEGAKKYRWQGRASMDAGKLAEALAVIKDDSQVILRLPSGTIPCANHPTPPEEALGEGYFHETLAAAHELAGLLSSECLEGATEIAARLVLRANRARRFAQTQDAPVWADVATIAAAAFENAKTVAKEVENAKDAKDESTRKTKTTEAAVKAVAAVTDARKALAAAKTAVGAESLDRSATSPRPDNADLLLQVSNQRWTLPGVLWYECDDA